MSLFHKLGFVVHPTKSVLKPGKEITYLGFVINSDTMRIRPTEEKRDKIKDLAVELLRNGSASIRVLARFIGMIVACFHGVMFGPLWYRRMEMTK